MKWSKVTMSLQEKDGRSKISKITEYPPEAKKIVACFGSSSTAAKGPYDWIHDLEDRPGNEHFHFLRFAAGGDLSYNGLQRLPEIIDSHPDYVIILMGVNDVLALTSKTHYRLTKYLLRKHLPMSPSPEWYRENMREIVRRLKSDTSAKIALCSMQPIGEDPKSTNQFQAEINRRISEYNNILLEIASIESVTYLPFYERFEDLILVSPGQTFTSFKILPLYRDVLRQFILHKSNDEIGIVNGWRYHRDGIHLNSISGKILADMVQEFINK